MEEKIKIFLIIGFLLVMSSCKKSPFDCFTSTGEITTQTRTITPYFCNINMFDNVDIELISSDEQKVEVTAGENIIDNIKTLISKEDSTLTIKNDNQCNWMRSYDKPLKVKIFYKEIESIYYYSIGNLTCLDTISSVERLLKSEIVIDTIFSSPDSINVIIDTIYTIKKVFSLEVEDGSGDINLLLNCFRSKIYYKYGTCIVTPSGHSDVSYITQTSFGYIDARNLSTKLSYIVNSGTNNCYINAANYIGAEITGIGNIYYKGNPRIDLIRIGSGNLLPLVE